MACARLNPARKDSNDVTVTATSGFTATPSNKQSFGNVVSLTVEVKNTSAISAGSSINPFTTNLTNGAALVSDQMTGHVASGLGRAWVIPSQNWAANTTHNCFIIGIL